MESQADTSPYKDPESNGNNNNAEEENGNDEPDAVPSSTRIKFDPEGLYYDMTGEKHLVVFNHYEFDENKNPLDKREWTGLDVAALQETFTSIGFKVDVHHDKDRETIWKLFLKLRNTDYSAASCLCIAILTHGHEGGRLSAYDDWYFLDHVTRLFQNHPTLAGKPKLFFVQACRGTQMDNGSRIETDGDLKDCFVIPSHADFLILRSTVEDYLSWRDCRGSWMIQELCNGIRKYRERLDILHIVTLIQREVAFAYASYVPEKMENSYKKQMVETTFTLTKILKL